LVLISLISLFHLVPQLLHTQMILHFYAFITFTCLFKPDMSEVIASLQDILGLGFWVSFSSEYIIGGPPFCFIFGFISQGEGQI